MKKWILSAFFAFSIIAQLSSETIEERLALGNLNSPIKVYVFTDWFCKACHILEPNLERMMPSIMSVATVYFIDFPIHKETLNFSPYNLAFMANNKSSYFELRQVLINLSERVQNPTKEQVIEAAKPLNIHLEMLTQSQTFEGLQFFLMKAAAFKIHQTPTVIIYNSITHGTGRLVGYRQITEEEILLQIDTLR